MGNFTFIHESDVTSGKITSQNARRTIRAHVMRKYRATTTQTTTDPQSRAPQPRNLEPQRAILMLRQPRRSDCPSVPERFLHSWSDKASNDNLVFSDEIENRCSEHDDESQSDLIQYQRNRSPSPSWYLNKVVDAFTYAGSSMSAKSYKYFEHYAGEFHLALCTIIQPIKLTETSICCSVAIQENSPALLHIMCFTGAAHDIFMRSSFTDVRGILRNPEASAKALEDCFRHKLAAIKHFSKTLQENPSSISEASLLCVALLLTAEAMAGSAGLKAHSMGLSKAVEVYGGWSAIPDKTAVLLYVAELKSAISLHKQPLFEIPSRLQSRFVNLATKNFAPMNPALDVLASRLYSSPVGVRFTQPIQHCIKNICHLTDFVETSRSSEKQSADCEIGDFIAVEHVLLRAEKDTNGDTVMECVRICLLIYINMSLWTAPSYFSWVTALMGLLKTTVSCVDLNLVAEHDPELVLWILFMGASAAAGKSDEEIFWWTTRAKPVVQVLGLSEWNRVSEILAGFLYTERTNGAAWKAIWDEATQSCAMNAIDGDSVVPQQVSDCRDPSTQGTPLVLSAPEYDLILEKSANHSTVNITEQDQYCRTI